MLGARVSLTGLKSKPELNGALGTVVADRGDGRWAVELLEDLQTLSIAARNLVPAHVPPAGASLHDSAEKVVHNVENFEATAQAKAHLPSFAGPAKDCRHGGPPPSHGNTGAVIAAIVGSLEATTAAHNRAVAFSQASGGSAIDAVVKAELDTLYRYWARPEMAALVRSDSYKVAFSCAVDATLDSEFTVARQFVRTGAFLRDWAKHGGAQMLADFTDPSGGARPSDEVMERYAESQNCLHKTRTDRGLKIYLATQLNGACTCLLQYAVDAQQSPKTGKCQACQKQLPTSQLKKCARCNCVEYCSRECQKVDWAAHKKACRAVSNE
jgi:hypothetical protein